MKLKADYLFSGDTLEVAKQLLGKIIVHKVNGKEIRGRILETEAYIGEDDQACHARFGRTKRNEVLYGEAGRLYVYLCYGLFNLLNIVTEEENYPAAILIRKIEPLSGNDPDLKSYGPGNLTKYLKIDRNLNGLGLKTTEEIYFEDDGFEVLKVEELSRVGIEYAGEYAKLKWRFVVNNSTHDPLLK